MKHDENCDSVGLGPNLEPSTKPCNCGAIVSQVEKIMDDVIKWIVTSDLGADLERVKAVLQEERSLYEHSMRERDELAAELERVTRERDAGAEMFRDYSLKASDEFTKLIADRDALRSRVERLQEAVNETWQECDDVRGFYCYHCGKQQANGPTHTETCIVGATLPDTPR